MTKKKKPRKRKAAAEALPELSPRQLAFVAHYISNGGNASQAAISAGYSDRTSGPRLLSNAIIRGLIDTHRAKVMAKWEITEDRILQRLASHAFTNLSDLMGDGRGIQLKPWDLIDPLHLPAIKGISEHEGAQGHSESITMHDPHRAMEMLVKYLGLFPKKDADGDRRESDSTAFKNAIERLRKRFSAE